MPVLVSVAAAPLSPQVMADMEKVYVDSPEFASGAAAAEVLADATSDGDTLYLGVFNGHNISAVLVRGDGDSRSMRYLCVHHATRGRGVAERLVAEVRRLEQERGTRWLEADFDLAATDMNHCRVEHVEPWVHGQGQQLGEFSAKGHGCLSLYLGRLKISASRSWRR